MAPGASGGCSDDRCSGNRRLTSALLWKRTRAPAVLTAIFTLALLPVLGLTLFTYQKFSTEADRYAYLALFAVALGVAMLLAWRPGRVSYIAATMGLISLAPSPWFSNLIGKIRQRSSTPRSRSTPPAWRRASCWESITRAMATWVERLKSIALRCALIRKRARCYINWEMPCSSNGVPMRRSKPIMPR